MKATNYWERFLATGKVEDYLMAKASPRETEGERDGGFAGDKADTAGEHPDAGTGKLDRYGFEGGACR